MDYQEFQPYHSRGGDAPPVRRGNGPLDRSCFPAHPDPQLLADARAAVLAPQAIAQQPRVRLLIWETLKAERGQTVNTVRLSAMQHAIAHGSGLGAYLLNPAATPINGGR